MNERPRRPANLHGDVHGREALDVHQPPVGARAQQHDAHAEVALSRRPVQRRRLQYATERIHIRTTIQIQSVVMSHTRATALTAPDRVDC